jgi:hypothetical protein
VTTVRTVIHDRRIDVPAPEDLPDGTEVISMPGDGRWTDTASIAPARASRDSGWSSEGKPHDTKGGRP